MITSFHLNANELNEDFLKKLKAMFKSKQISITVEEEMDETDYLLSTAANRKHLEESLSGSEGISFTMEEFMQYEVDTKKGKKPSVQGKKVKLK